MFIIFVHFDQQRGFVTRPALVRLARAQLRFRLLWFRLFVLSRIMFRLAGALFAAFLASTLAAPLDERATDPPYSFPTSVLDVRAITTARR